MTFSPNSDGNTNNSTIRGMFRAMRRFDGV